MIGFWATSLGIAASPLIVPTVVTATGGSILGALTYRNAKAKHQASQIKEKDFTLIWIGAGALVLVLILVAVNNK